MPMGNRLCKGGRKYAECTNGKIFQRGGGKSPLLGKITKTTQGDKSTVKMMRSGFGSIFGEHPAFKNAART